MKVYQIPAFEDNYLYLLNSNNLWAAIDPGDAAPIIDFLEKKNAKLDFIFNTHHHLDHVGGNKELFEKYQAKIYCSSYDYDQKRVPYAIEPLKHGDKVLLGEKSATVLDCTGHTLGHIAYWFESENKLFIGDTLFAMGCGRLFEGSYEQMLKTLNQLKSLLPEDIDIFCAHEYTQKNAEFALGLDPLNPDLKARYEQIKALRKDLKPTVPFKLSLELKTNPFLRAEKIHPNLTKLEAFTAIRKARNQF